MKQKAVWIVGAGGRIGSQVARLLSNRGCSLVLVGRSAAELQRLAVNGRQLVALTPQEIAVHLRQQRDIVVCNCVGPFAETATLFVSALGDGSAYLDLSNDIASWRNAAALGPAAATRNQRVV